MIMPNESNKTTPLFSDEQKVAATFVVTTLASYALFKRNGYHAALHLYKKGGGGLNIYQNLPGKVNPKRRFAIDYHPFWDKETCTRVCKLHCHYGKTNREMKYHRPYQGGW